MLVVWGNGAFTKALVEGLSGKADYQANGVITVNELDLYLAERVKVLTGAGRLRPGKRRRSRTTTRECNISSNYRLNNGLGVSATANKGTSGSRI